MLSANTFDVMVIGAGVVGMTAALVMSQRGYSVALMDASRWAVDFAKNDPRMYAINHASETLFQSLGIWDTIHPSRQSPYQQMHVWDSVSGAQIDFDSRMIGHSHLGTILSESVIKQALMEQMTKENIAIFSECQISSVQEAPQSITISDGRHVWKGSLLMVADGANSATRALLGVPITTWPYHQKAIITRVQTERPHLKAAHQVFRPNGPLAFLPLPDPHECSVVWSVGTSKATRLMRVSDDVFSEQLTAAFEERLGRTHVMDQRCVFPLQMRHAKVYAGSHWLLMGDAAHTIHPLAGLGLNLGLSDVTTWRSLISANKAALSARSRLQAYQRQRKAEVWRMIALMGGLKTLFANPFIAPLRGLGLRACNHMLPLKQFLIEQAAR